jgi:phenylpropionate dioxygenase-like ring-hydroxylating dioxygenase large terminal subunit
MTDTTARTEFAQRNGGTGVVIQPRRTDYADPQVRAADQAQLLRRVTAHVHDGTTDLAAKELLIDPAEFVDPQRWEAERALFFRRTPQLAAYSAELPGPNTYTTKDVAGVPVVITRDGDGQLHAFRNVCSHRASEVAAGCGEARRLACPYHNWVYALDGTLTGMPGREGFDSLDWAGLALPPLPIDEADGFVYVGLDPDLRVDVHEILGDELAGILACERVDHVVPRRLDVHMSWACNWKLTYDTFCENYHFVYLHKDSFGDPGPVVNNLMVADRWGWHGRETMCPMSLRDAVNEARDTTGEPMGIAYFLYPNAILIVSEIHQEMFRIYPGDHPGESYLYQTYALYDDSEFLDDEAFSTMMYDAIRTALADEDAPMAGSIQRKLDAGLVDRLIYGRNELILHHNHEGWNAELAAAGRSRRRQGAGRVGR